MFCNKCNKNRKPEEFYPYRLSECKYCTGARTANDYIRRRDAGDGQEQARRHAWHLRTTFGITTERFEALLANQNGHCALCSKDKPGGQGAWHVDHDHATGTIRGLLCARCNQLLGVWEKNRPWFDGADMYLANPPATRLSTP